MDPSSYPQAPRDESVVDDYHGTPVPDAYRALEDPDAAVTREFVDKLNGVSRPFIDACPAKARIHKRLTELWDHAKYGCTSKHGSHYFYGYNAGLQNQSVMYIQESLEDDGRVFFDPNTLSADGTTAVAQRRFTSDGSIMAYALSERGSDWNTAKFKRVPSGDDLPDELTKIKFSGLEWTNDNAALFYSKYAEASSAGDGTATEKHEFHSLYCHKLGRPQSDDILVARFDDHADYMVHGEVSDNGEYLVVTADKGCDPHNLLYYFNLAAVGNLVDATTRHKLHALISTFEAKYDFVDSDGASFLVHTDWQAPMYKLVRIHLDRPHKDEWETVLPEGECRLNWVAPVRGDLLVANYIEHVKHVLHIYNTSGQHLARVPLPMGSVGRFFGRKRLSEVFFTFCSFDTPGIVYRCDLTDVSKLQLTVLREVTMEGVDLRQICVKQVFYKSSDGTKVPMYMVHHKSTDITIGSTPTILYGYGGFNISMMPGFSASRLLFTAHLGGLVAVANIRGGSEYGEKWHQDGMLFNKQTVFDDMHAAADYLVDTKVTSRSRLCIMGGSNGGLLVAACANQRPMSYAAVVNQVGVNDMLRYALFTIGAAWVPEFGDPIKSADAFNYIYRYSPLHNLRSPTGNWQYPAMLITTADHDDRVVPLHSIKYMAQLYHCVAGTQQRNPLVARVELRAGHGAGKPTSKIIDECADLYSFLYRVLNLEWIE